VYIECNPVAHEMVVEKMIGEGGREGGYCAITWVDKIVCGFGGCERDEEKETSPRQGNQDETI